MTTDFEKKETEIRCLFRRKPRLTEHCLRLRTKSLEANNPQISCPSITKYHYSFMNSRERYAKDNNVYIYVHKKKRNNNKQRRKYNIYHYSKNEIIFLINSKKSNLSEHCSMLELRSIYKNKNLKQVQSSNLMWTTNLPYNRNYIVNNCCRTCDKPECGNPFTNPSIMAKIYRCQMAKEDTCCCSCNSDAMFEVMKSLYDCYKKKNCENCNCILCGFGKQKRTVGVGEEEIESLEGKSDEEKEKYLRELAMNKKPFPIAKTPADKALMEKVRRDLGVTPEAKNSAERNKIKDAYKNGLIVPLEGKTLKEKENILKKLISNGIPLPEGRTPSEKKLINSLLAAGPSLASVPSAKVRQAKQDGLLTPLSGKSPQQQEKILKGLAKLGIPLPKGKTESQNKIINKIRNELGLPAEPKSSAERTKLRKAYAAGIVTPLEGKTPEQKEQILRKMAEAGITLPEGRTPSEKALVSKIKAPTVKKPSGIPSEKFKKAQAEGLITPLEGKTPEQKEKILKGLAVNGIPLPQGKTQSEKVLIDKIRKDMGLPPAPKNSAEKQKFQQAYADGIITPLEGKTPEQKEQVLRKMVEAGVPLPEGRTPSEKALINNVRAPLKKRPSGVPSDKYKKAVAEGLITPLEGKTPEQKEKILKGLAVNGIPLPEGKSPSEKALIDKIRNDMGLPPEPKNDAEKEMLKQAYADGIITPLEGKTPEQKEKALIQMAEAGIPLPEGRTPSEKALVDKVKKTAKKKPFARVRIAKTEGLITPLEGKTPEQKEKIIKGLATHGIPLPEGKTPSEKALIDKVRKEIGLPPEPKTSAEKKRIEQAYADGIITPLEGKTPEQKEQVLRKMAEAGVPLPEGRSPSEKALVDKVKATTMKIPSEKLRKAKAEGFITPLEGKTPDQKEKIVRGLAKHGIPLPEGKTTSEKALIDKVRQELGLPPEPKTSAEKKKIKQAYADGIITPLEGKTPEQKENALRKMAEAGVPLPEGRTPSEKALVAKVKATTARIPSEKLRKATAAGFMTPLEGKTPEQKEKIVKGMAKHGIPLPEGKTPSEKAMIDKVRQELGLPPEPKTSAEKKKIKQAYADGIITPLEGKTPEQKEKALRKMAEAGVSLPEGRTPSEKALVDKVKATTARIPSEKLRKATAAGFMTPLEGKTPEQKEKIVKGMAKHGIPLPEGKTPSEKAVIDKVRQELGLPPEPKTSAEKKRINQAYADGIITPLEGKTPEQKEKALRKMAEAGVPLPEGRTPSEKALVDKVKATTARIPSEKLRKAKEEGFLTPLEGKTPEQKEKIVKGLAKHGIPLPEGKTPSEKAVIDKVRQELGLPPEPKTSAEKNKIKQAYADGIITPLEGKTPEQKEKALRKMAEAGVPLPEGRTPSEKALVDKVKATTARIPSEKLRKATAAGFMTPLEGKTPEQKEKIVKGMAKHGIPLPEGKTPSEKAVIDKVRQELGLPPEPKTSAEKKRINQAYADGIITPLEGKTPEQKEKALRKMAEAGVPLPEGRTPSEKALVNKVKAITARIPSEKIRKARAEGFITPLTGKTPEQKERILKGLANNGIPLPEGKTPSEKALVDKVRKELGLPPEPKNTADKLKMKHAYAQGLITPLEGKTPTQKENILRKMVDAGLPLPEGRTPSEQAMVNKVRAERPKLAPSEKLKKAKEGGLLTPLQGKTPEQKEKIVRGLAELGLPLPEGKTDSEKAVIDKIRKDIGLPPEPKTPSEKVKLAKLYAKGLVTPLEGKTPEQKESILKKMADAGISLPEGRTPSEKALIDKVKATTVKVPSERLRKAKAEGLITPLEGKTPEQKENIVRGLGKLGIPLPEGKTPSEKALIDKVRQELGLPPEPKTSAEKKKIKQAYADGIITPLEGKTPEQKEQALRKMAEAGIPMPEGRTPSEKALVNQVKATTARMPSEKIRKATAAGFMTPLEGKTPEQKEKIVRGLAKHGIPLPEGKTPSEKALVDKVRQELGLPPEPKTSAEKKKIKKAYADGIITPLEGKSPEQKEQVLRKMAEAGIPLPEGRTPSEKALVDKVKATTVRIPSEKLQKAKEEGFITPLEGKTPEQKDKIVRGLAKHGIPLPEGKTPSEKALIDKVRQELGLPPEPKTSGEKKRIKQAYVDGIITPLEGKTPEQKEKALRKMAEAGVPLPEGRTPSEKALVDKVKATTVRLPSEKLRKATAAGFMTPLEGKTPEQKEKIVRGLATHGVPLPEGKTPSEKALIDKVRQDLGLPPEPKTSGEKKRIKQAYADGIITPLEGKTPEQKEKALRKMAEAGVPLPEGRSPSEKALVNKIKATTARIPSEKIRKAKAEGFITPLEGKTPEQKEKIVRGLAKHGIPLPEGKTPSEKKLVDKVRQELGLPPEPKTSSEKKKLMQAYANGIVTPLEGKTPEQKEAVLTKMAEAGIPLPEGRTPSEKALVDKVKQTAKKVPSKVPSGIPSAKLRKAKEEGFLTPLAGKTPEQKENILKGLAKHGIPMPEGKTASEQKIIDKVKQEMGLPPEPKNSEEKRRLQKAYAKGIVTPLEGKTPEQKEAALRKMAEAGIPLPEGRTSSEKALIDKVKDTTVRRPTGVASEKFAKAKAAGIITPLEGKTPEQKKKILQGLATHGIPFPDGKTPSEKKMIGEVRKEMGLPPLPKTASEKALMAQAYADGVITPLEGKTPEQKEKALAKMLEAGISLPEGRTESEKALIEKVKAQGPRLSQAKKRLKEKAQGIEAEEIQEISKTTKCDRACGCDRKKIRFKHSYVKIRVTSPDISSFCDCPDECIPGVKGGVFVDNEGIKVTIGYTSVSSGFQSKHGSISKTDLLDKSFNPKFMSFCSAALGSDASLIKTPLNNLQKDKINNRSYLSRNVTLTKQGSKDTHSIQSTCILNTKEETEDSSFTDYSSLYMISSKLTNNTNFTEDIKDQSSYESIVLLGTESSLSLSIDSHATELATISVISFDSSATSVLSYDNMSANSKIGLQISRSRAKHIISNANYSSGNLHRYFDDRENCFYSNDHVTILRFTRSKKSKSKDKKKEKRVLINEPDRDNIMQIVAKEILNQKSDSSSVFVVVQSEDDTNTDASSVPSQSTNNENSYKLRESYPIVASEHQMLIASRGVKLISTPRDMTELVPVKQKKTKTRKSKIKHFFGRPGLIANSKSENEIDFEETELNKIESIDKREIQKSDHIADSTKTKLDRKPYFEGTQLCTYHRKKNSQKVEKQKGTIISLEPKKQQFLGFDLNVQCGASQTSQIKPRCLKLSKTTNVNQVIETTRSLTLMCQKAVEVDIENKDKSIKIVPEYEPKGLDTSCDRPCTCPCKIKSEVVSLSSPALSENYNNGLELSADEFIRNSIPYLYQACQYVSPYSEPSDFEPCKCCTKIDTNNIHSKTNELNNSTSELWIDYGIDQKQVVSKYASPSDLLPCMCVPKNKQPDSQQYYTTERVACSANGNEQLTDSNYLKHKQNLKLIQQAFQNRFREKVLNSKQIVNSPQTNWFSSKNNLDQDHSYEAEYAKRAASYTGYLLDNNPYATPSLVYIMPDNTLKTTAKHVKACPNCNPPFPMNNKNQDELVQKLAYTDFLGQCPETKNIVKLPCKERVTYASYANRGPEFANIKQSKSPTVNNQTILQNNNVNYANYNGQCPESINVAQKTFKYRKNEQEMNKNNCTSLYGESRTVHLSQAIIYDYGVPGEVPPTPPPTRRPTKKESCSNLNINEKRKDDVDENTTVANNEQTNNKADKSPEKEMCNDCCVRGKIVDCVSPGRACEPCERYGQFVPQGLKLSNTCHTKLHLRDLLVYEDSSHRCCCITSEDNTNTIVEGVTNFCKDYCSGETVEEIRDAVERFMKAREQGLVCNSKTFTKQNICDETRELFQGIDQIVEERERMIADENCQCPQINSNTEDNCRCPSKEPQNTKKKQEKPIAPLVDIHHVGLRERSLRRCEEDPTDPNLCQCRFPKNKMPLENCVCPRNRHCECPELSEEQWFEYFTKGMKMTRKEAIKLQTELTQTTSGFKFMKRRKFCGDINTYDEALDYYNEHEGLERIDGHIKANPDGTCPGCGDMNCPGLWVRNYFDPNNFDPQKLVDENLSRYAKETDKECVFPKCKDNTCPGMGPYGLLPPIPGGSVDDVKITGVVEKTGKHKACTCEPKEDFENDVYCPPEGPVYCECAAGSNVSCECPPGPDETKDDESSKLKGWDKGPCGPIGGLKVTLPGKGTASTGLQGICCFNAYETFSKTSLKSASSDSSTYVVYV